MWSGPVLLFFLIFTGDAGKSWGYNSRSVTQGKPKLVTSKETRLLKFDFGDNGTVERDLEERGLYDRRSILPFDVQGDYSIRNRLFVTTPKFRPGTPVSLSTVAAAGGTAQMTLTPYPSVDMHHYTQGDVTDCPTTLVSIVSTAKTWSDANKLYALDSGIENVASDPTRKCPPKVVVFDLHNDTFVNSTEITNALCNSLYLLIQVESCPAGTLVAYVTDPTGFRLTVTDLITGISRHLQSQYFHPSPGFGFTAAGGPAYYFMYGLEGVAVDKSCSGNVYLQPYSSNIQAVLEKEPIRNAADGEILDLSMMVALPGRRSGVAGALAVDATGQRLFFPIAEELAIYCWNTSKPYSQENFRLIAKDDERLQSVGGLKIEAGSGRLWALSNRYTNYLTNTTDYCQINYRIMYIDISDIVC